MAPRTKPEARHGGAAESPVRLGLHQGGQVCCYYRGGHPGSPALRSQLKQPGLPQAYQGVHAAAEKAVAGNHALSPLEATTRFVTRGAGTVGYVIRSYLESPIFQGLSPSTQRQYRAALTVIGGQRVSTLSTEIVQDIHDLWHPGKLR